MPFPAEKTALGSIDVRAFRAKPQLPGRFPLKRHVLAKAQLGVSVTHRSLEREANALAENGEKAGKSSCY